MPDSSSKPSAVPPPAGDSPAESGRIDSEASDFDMPDHSELSSGIQGYAGAADGRDDTSAAMDLQLDTPPVSPVSGEEEVLPLPDRPLIDQADEADGAPVEELGQCVTWLAHVSAAHAQCLPHEQQLITNAQTRLLLPRGGWIPCVANMSSSAIRLQLDVTSVARTSPSTVAHMADGLMVIPAFTIEGAEMYPDDLTVSLPHTISNSFRDCRAAALVVVHSNLPIASPSVYLAFDDARVARGFHILQQKVADMNARWHISKSVDALDMVQAAVSRLNSQLGPAEGDARVRRALAQEWRVHDMNGEWARQGIMHVLSPLDGSQAFYKHADNHGYDLCPTYSQEWMVPSCISPDQIRQCTQQRSRGRIPVVNWRHRVQGTVLARSAQPNKGIQFSAQARSPDHILCRAIQDVGAAYVLARAGSQAAAAAAAAGNGVLPTPAASPPGAGSSPASSPPAASPRESIAASLDGLRAQGHARSTAAANKASSGSKFDRIKNSMKSAMVSKQIDQEWQHISTSQGFVDTASTATAHTPPHGSGPASVSQHSAPLAATPSRAASSASATRAYKRELLIIDCRPSGNAHVNHLIGGGYERYPDCELQFVNIHNIHKVRQAMANFVRALAVGTPSQSAYGEWSCNPAMDTSRLAATEWYDHIRTLLGAGVQVAHALHVDRRSVLVHCSDGWDRTSAVCSLAQIWLDPYFRTLEGLAVLIAKEWAAFGHRFCTRAGFVRGQSLKKDASPIFLQWLDTLASMVRAWQFAFEYTPTALAAIAWQMHTARYGEFLTDCDRERRGDGGRGVDWTKRSRSALAWLLCAGAWERRVLDLPDAAAGAREDSPGAYAARVVSTTAWDPAGWSDVLDAETRPSPAAAPETSPKTLLGIINPAYDAGTNRAILLPPTSVVYRCVSVWEEWWFRGAHTPCAPLGACSASVVPGFALSVPGVPVPLDCARSFASMQATAARARPPASRVQLGARLPGAPPLPPCSAAAASCPWLRWVYAGDGLGWSGQDTAAMLAHAGVNSSLDSARSSPATDPVLSRARSAETGTAPSKADAAGAPVIARPPSVLWAPGAAHLPEHLDPLSGQEVRRV